MGSHLVKINYYKNQKTYFHVVWTNIQWQMPTFYMINSPYISSHHMEIGFIVFIVINFNEVGSHREFIF
jgi:hypothetical protein